MSKSDQDQGRALARAVSLARCRLDEAVRVLCAASVQHYGEKDEHEDGCMPEGFSYFEEVWSYAEYLQAYRAALEAYTAAQIACALHVAQSST